MSLFILISLCIVQGLTEFLPISSSGHLLLFEQLFGFEENLLLLNLFLHLATVLAVIIVYRKILWKLIKNPFQPLTYKLAISTTITVLFAAAYNIFDINDFVPKIYGFCFLITAILLLATHFFQKKSAVVKLNREINLNSSIVVGIVQGFAVLPGLSRSGSTISSLILCGNDEDSAAEYSFLLSLPIIVGGFIVELISGGGEIVSSAIIPAYYYVIAFLTTFVVSIASLKLTIKLLKKNKFIFFSIYLLFISIFVLVFNFII